MDVATVALADPMPMMRAGIRCALDKVEGFPVVAETGDARRVAGLCASFRPDIVILELQFKDVDGLGVIDELTSSARTPKILVYTAITGFSPLLRAFALGAHGAVSKYDAPGRLVEALSRLRDNQAYIPPELVEPVLTRRLDRNAPRDPVDSLTNRELEVMRHLAQGDANGSIAKALGISTATVASHRNKILRKLALRNNADIARFATRQGLLS